MLLLPVWQGMKALVAFFLMGTNEPTALAPPAPPPPPVAPDLLTAVATTTFGFAEVRHAQPERVVRCDLSPHPPARGRHTRGEETAALPVADFCVCGGRAHVPVRRPLAPLLCVAPGVVPFLPATGAPGDLSAD